MIRRWIIVALCGASSTACFVPVETGRQMQQDIRDLQKELREAHKTVAEQRARLDEQMQRAEGQIREVDKALQDINRAARMTDAEFGVKLERMVREVQELRGNTELADYRLRKLEGTLEGEGSLVTRVEALERGASASGLNLSREGGGKVPKGKKDLLAYGVSFEKKGEVADARGVYREVIKRWPREGGVADQAYFRLGELYYAEKNCASAVQEYIQVVEKFANGAFVDDAYYKIGLCSLQLGNLEDAEIFFTEIISNHRRSPLLKSARAKLDDVKKRLAKEKKKSSKKRGKSK